MKFPQIIKPTELPTPQVFGVVSGVNNERGYFFVQPDDGNGPIRCHMNQGGKVFARQDGKLIFKTLGLEIPIMSDEIVLIRVSEDPDSNEFTLAKMWVPMYSYNAALRLATAS